MTQPLHRRLSVFVIAAAASLAAWQFLPSTPLDRATFRAVIHGFANPPLLISGHGTHAEPWTFRTIGRPTVRDSKSGPPLAAITDDPDGIFQASPPSPIDVAVILQNFKRLGASSLSIAAVLAWDEPDTIGLAALDRLMADFQPLATAAPVTRGATPAPLPPAFRNASLPLDAVRGQFSQLPTVNRLPIPTVILGGENATAGFTTIESEPAHRAIPLIAVWEDRVIFAFPVIATLARLNLEITDLEIRLGEFLKFGPTGPIIPIDANGRFTPPPASLTAPAAIPATELIDAETSPFGETSPVLLDLQSAADPQTLTFSTTLPGVLAAIISEAGLTRPATIHRLSRSIEIGLLLALAALAALFPGKSHFASNLHFAVIAVMAIAAQWIATGAADIWLPAIPILTGTLVAGAFVRLAPPPRPRIPRAKPQKLPAPEKPAPVTPPPAPAPPAKPAKTPPAKKAAKKTAKKAPKKSGRRK